MAFVMLHQRKRGGNRRRFEPDFPGNVLLQTAALGRTVLVRGQSWEF
jgi:hypothetical protein